MVRVLLIDDDKDLLGIFSDYLRKFGHRVDTQGSGEEALRALVKSPPDVVVLDVSMPGMDGWEVLRRIRAASKVPVIMLTARAEEPEVLEGFKLGADDYVSKPFSFAQMEARIRAVQRRAASGQRAAEMKLSSGDLEVDLESHRVSRRGESIKLTPTEFRLLVVLMEEPGKIMSPDQLVRRVWGEQYAAESDYVRRYVWYLRRKIEDNPDQPRYIRNERNVGYYFAKT
jgi:two-component system KDP operon response regulator KdpE